MNLYIETENGAVKNHPALEGNLMQAFGEIPTHWEPFVRVERPNLVYQILNSDIPTYEKVNGVWTDVWDLRDMTAEEKAAAQADEQQAVIDAFSGALNAYNFSAWTFDQATNAMIPPIPRPEPDQTKLDARIRTYWCGVDNNWKDTPVRPEGPEDEYMFDFASWQWKLFE